MFPAIHDVLSSADPHANLNSTLTMSRNVDYRSQWLNLGTAFNDLEKVLCEKSSLSDKVFYNKFAEVISDFVAAHQDRPYHNLEHISEMLAFYKEFESELEDPTAVLLAVLFHDYVYVPGSKTNEQESTEYVDALLAELEINDEGLRSKVHMYINATKDHTAQDAALDLQYFLDWGMAILGAPPIRYQDYAASVYEEFSGVCTQEQYAKGRVKLFIEPTLASDRIFQTPKMFERFESIARLNMQRERLALLTSL